ncbi:unnamed protein product [Orchesella dallaii]|uniref:Uncharacterized protein n=1 Tax=Orchesella dallaii TaxID=48710 RepID=A0ABP1PUA9_9HEXA
MMGVAVVLVVNGNVNPLQCLQQVDPSFLHWIHPHLIRLLLILSLLSAFIFRLIFVPVICITDLLSDRIPGVDTLFHMGDTDKLVAAASRMLYDANG